MRTTAPEGVPGLVVGCAHRGENRRPGLDSRREAAKKPTTKALCPPESVHDQKIDTVRKRIHQCGLGINQLGRAHRAGSQPRRTRDLPKC